MYDLVRAVRVLISCAMLWVGDLHRGLEVVGRCFPDSKPNSRPSGANRLEMRQNYTPCPSELVRQPPPTQKRSEAVG